MKLHRILIILTLSALFALPSTSFAAKGKNKAAGDMRRAMAAASSYDKNNNGQLEGDEIDALKKDFTADPKGKLAVFDKNNSGTLEDDEIAAINARLSKRAARTAKKGKKNSNNS